MTKITEIAVVGAGPAGSVAAKAAAKAGAEVVLIDRKAEIGSPVQCGGFLPEAHELRALLPRAHLPETLIEVPKRHIIHRTSIQRMYGPSGKSKEFHVDGRVIDRRGFDRHLAKLAARAGAEIMTATRARLEGSRKSCLELSGHHSGRLEAKVIVGADGPASGIARSAGIELGSDMGICIEYEMVDVEIDPNAAEMYFGTKSAPGGYAWIIPLGNDAANVGVGVRNSYLDQGENLRRILDRFIEGHPIAGDMLHKGEVVAVMRGLVPASGMPPRVLRGNVILAGDAAGLVMATSGGGIPLAMVAGSAAGNAAAAYVAKGQSLDVYQAEIEKAMGKELENSVRIKYLVEKVMRSDRLMDALFAMLPSDQMKATQRGQVPEALSRFCDLVANL